MVKVTLAQMHVVAGQWQRNLNVMLRSIHEARERRSQMIVFPELALPGYFLGDNWERDSFIDQLQTAHDTICKNSENICVIFGSVGSDKLNKNEDGRPRKYNAAFICHNGRYLVHPVLGFPFWPKTLLPQYRQFDDSRYFFDLRKLAQEKQVPVESLLRSVSVTLETSQGSTPIRLGILVCEDMWHSDYALKPAHVLAPQSDVLVNLSASPYSIGKSSRRLALVQKISQESGCPLIYVNAVGVQNTGKVIYAFDGGSALCSPGSGPGVSSGIHAPSSVSMWSLHPPFESHDVDVCLDIQNRTCVPVVGSHFSHTGGVTAENGGPYPHWDEALPPEPPLSQVLRFTLKTTCQEWGITRAVVGVSGGIDSAVSAVLLSQVLGASQMLLINMPSRFNSQLTQSAAKKLAHALGCYFEVLPIEPLLSACQATFAKGTHSCWQGASSGLAFENLQARIRGSTLLATAASVWGGVFSCNANKAELTVGYGTLYGDLGGFLCPLGDLWKGQVRQLAHELNAESDRCLIPQETLDVVPSAELSENQDVTQGQGDPLRYDYHDALFRYWIESWNRPTKETLIRLFDANALEQEIGLESLKIKDIFVKKSDFLNDLNRWWNLYNGLGAVKRVQAPPICAVSRRPLGFDHRESLLSRTES